MIMVWILSTFHVLRFTSHVKVTSEPCGGLKRNTDKKWDVRLLI
jgi:hypothetical protein